MVEEIRRQDIALVGGKNASLGEMIRNLGKKEVSIPPGFAVTAEAYKYMVEKADMGQKIRDTLADLDTRDMENLADKGLEEDKRSHNVSEFGCGAVNETKRSRGGEENKIKDKKKTHAKT